MTISGSRDRVQKVSRETILCLITLVIDFPTMSAASMAMYINSKYGPNFRATKHVSERTVQRYLSSLRFKVKKSSFAPPNRNSVGLRLYRVAWCHIIEDILNDPNTLIAFIDEAAVTNCEGRKYGRAYAAITPVLNNPLSKVKMTVIAMIIPSFGVLYKFIDNACTGLQYAQFLREAVHFIRRYICNSVADIIIIEDNCPMHCTKEVEKEVAALDIALLPIVQYSPSLNGPIENYYGLVKTNNILTKGAIGEIAIRSNIESNWKETTNKLVDEELTEMLFMNGNVECKYVKKVCQFIQHMNMQMKK